MFIAPLAALLFYMCGLFIVSLWREDNGTADIGYGGGFIVAIAAMLATTTPGSAARILAALPFIWGVRLAYRIYRKNRGKPEDFRYKAWRESWGRTFVLRSFLQVYLLQGAVIALVSSPVLFSLAYPGTPIPMLFWTGIVLWVIGFAFEAIGDAQLDRFLKDTARTSRIMSSGLWRYSRHPNYFGESLMWWGIAIAASGIIGISGIALVGFLSPLLITYLLLFVSGVPLLEQRFAGDPEWEAYKARTSVFVPLPPRRI